MEIVLDGNQFGTLPTETELTAWVEAYALTVTTVARVDDRARNVFADREYAYIIDLWTMQVVWREQALFTTPTIVDIGIDTILSDFL